MQKMRDVCTSLSGSRLASAKGALYEYEAIDNDKRKKRKDILLGDDDVTHFTILDFLYRGEL